MTPVGCCTCSLLVKVISVSYLLRSYDQCFGKPSVWLIGIKAVPAQTPEYTSSMARYVSSALKSEKQATNSLIGSDKI